MSNIKSNIKLKFDKFIIKKKTTTTARNNTWSTSAAGPPHTLSHWGGSNFSKMGNFKAVSSNLV